MTLPASMLRGLQWGSRLLAMIAIEATPLHAQVHPVTWVISAPSTALAAGIPFTAQAHATIPQGWHLYSISEPPGGPIGTSVELPAESGFIAAGPVTARAPDVAEDPNFNLKTETYTDSVTLNVPVITRSGGKRTLAFDITYQACTDRFCLPPRIDSLTLAIAVSGPAASGPVAIAGTTASTGGGASLLLFLWAAAVMGALSLLTPCVFPMIPITVSFFSNRDGTRKTATGRNALIYGASIVATFTAAGMAIALLADASGLNRVAANPWLNLAVTAIFIAFAFNLFGLYQIRLPASWLTRLDAATRRTGGSETAGLVLTGFTFTLTSFTCTVPFLGTLLVMAAQGNWRWSLAGLLVYSSVFALPFFLLALLPGALGKLPRSGAWLGRLKVVLGLLELGFALKFLSNADMVLRWGVFNRTVVLAVWLVIAVAIAAYVAGVTHWRSAPRRLPSAPALVGTAVMLAAALYLARGLTGARMGELESFLPPPEGIVTHGTTAPRDDLPWLVNDYKAALDQARREHKDVIVDFTGYTCTNCRWMEANMFPRDTIKARLSQMVRVRLYTDGDGDIYRAQQKMELEQFGTVALPYYAIVDSTGAVRAQFLGMTRDTGEFLTFLAAGGAAR
ncbi:MAG TPA: cytochrome c biogenesis protein CcdA [Gemmatimonadales bacterium]|nr:cytochrome c biogenesis protein CcdA [Gemmatimonadales bacterium]